IWTGTALLIAGPDTGPVVEADSPRATIVGIRFRPGAAMAWLKLSAAEIANRRLPVADLWGRRARRLEEELFESATPDGVAAVLERSLAAETSAAAVLNPAVQNLRGALRGGAGVHE